MVTATGGYQDDWIALAETEINQSYNYTQISNISYEVVRRVNVGYKEYGHNYADHFESFIEDTDIAGKMDTCGADICILLVDDEEENGWTESIPATNKFDSYAVVHWDAATGNYSFAHEIGHLHGCRHEWIDQREDSEYHGWISDGDSLYRTIMATNNHTGYTRINYWSNLVILVEGDTMGTSIPIEKGANCRKALMESGGDISLFNSPIPPPTPQNLTITNAGHINESPILSWDASTAADEYKVYRTTGTLYPTGWGVITTTSSTGYTDEEVIITSEQEALDSYHYRVKAFHDWGISGYSNIVNTWGEGLTKPFVDLNKSQPREFALRQSYPNPSNPTTTIQYDLPEAGHVVMEIVNLMGQEVKILLNEYREAGFHSIVWDGTNNQGHEVQSGIYMYTLQVGGRVFTNKLTFVR